MQSIENEIEWYIEKKKRGKIYFSKDFHEFGSDGAVRIALMRLTDNKILVRLAPGIFYYPMIDKELGVTLLPSIENIAEALAKRDKARIIPTGDYAKNKLGLSTQVPTNVVFLTDTSPRKVKIGKSSITFKKAASKNFAYKSYITMLISFALSEIGKECVTPQDIAIITPILLKEDKLKIEKDLPLMAAWERKIIKDIIYERKNELA
ncbi:hypothetical protein FACS189411_10150 [Bacteroidia bacterium]|nr:hypothetical protein FACS189411_10150 [Bacteroidia bacterium]